MSKEVIIEKAFGAPGAKLIEVQKDFDDNTLNHGGRLSPARQDAFIVLVAGQSKLLRELRFVQMDGPSVQIDKLHINEPVTEGADAGVALPANVVGKSNQITLTAVKMRSAWDTLYEFTTDNIEGTKVEDTLVRNLSARISYDLELLSVQGDTTIAGNVTKMDRLLRKLDGFDVLSENSHIVQGHGQPISNNMFIKMNRKMPSAYKGHPDLRFILKDDIANDWLNVISNRATVGGDAAIGGKTIYPVGIPFLTVPAVPSDKPITINTGTEAEVVGTGFGPFYIDSGIPNNTLLINITGAGLRTITLPDGTLDTVQVVNLINSVFAANGDPAEASDNGEHQIRIRTNDVGVAHTITIDAGSTALLVLGLASGSVAGSNAASNGVLREGSFVLLTTPKNLIFGMVGDTRFYSKYNSNSDKQETRVYNQVAANIENPDTIVKLKDVRVNPL